MATRVSESTSLAFSRTAPARSIAANILSNTVADDEHFFLGDAEQIVVVRAALDDASRGAIQIGRFIDDHRRIARPGDDRPLASFSCAARATAGPPVTQISFMPRWLKIASADSIVGSAMTQIRLSIPRSR